MTMFMGIAGALLGITALVLALSAIVQPILRLVPVGAIRSPQRTFPHADPRGLRVPRP